MSTSDKIAWIVTKVFEVSFPPGECRFSKELPLGDILEWFEYRHGECADIDGCVVLNSTEDGEVVKYIISARAGDIQIGIGFVELGMMAEEYSDIMCHGWREHEVFLKNVENRLMRRDAV